MRVKSTIFILIIIVTMNFITAFGSVNKVMVIKNVTWHGTDKDVVGSGISFISENKKDGHNDGHFKVTAGVNTEIEIDMISIENKQFSRTKNWTWMYNGLSILETNMKLVNNGKTIEFNPKTPREQYIVKKGVYTWDIYLSGYDVLNGEFKFKNGQKFEIGFHTITEDGKRRYIAVQVVLNSKK